MSVSKNKGNNYLFGILKYLFFLATVYFIYVKVFKQNSTAQVFKHFNNATSIHSLLWFFISFLLMFLNWGLESEKWRRMMKRIYPISFLTSLKATFSGTSFGIFTPNRVGSFIGNILYIPTPYKAEATVMVWLSSVSQFLATVTFGLFGILLVNLLHKDIYLREYSNYLEFSFGAILLAFIVLGYLAYFNAKFFIKHFSKIKWVEKHLDKLEVIKTFSFKSLFSYWVISVVRYLVFVLQFYFVFRAFSINITPFDFFLYICLLYGIITFLPSMFGKLGVREAVLLILFSSSEYSQIQIISASFALWFLNVIIPAFLGAIFILNVKKNN